MSYSIFTFTQKPDFRGRINRLGDEAWPAFLREGNIYHWHLLFEMFAEYQLLFVDSEDNLIAVGHTIPLIWDGSLSDLPQTMEEILLRAKEAHENGQAPNTLSAMAAMVSARHRGENLSGRVVNAMRGVAREHGCTSLIAPVRPPWKSRYPLTPMEHYVEWKREDGAPLDPWIRVHWRLGAQPLCIAPNTLTVENTIAQWEAWTGMAFPESGSYIVPGALQPVQMDCENNVGRYEDPNYWMKHSAD